LAEVISPAPKTVAQIPATAANISFFIFLSLLQYPDWILVPAKALLLTNHRYPDRDHLISHTLASVLILTIGTRLRPLTRFLHFAYSGLATRIIHNFGGRNQQGIFVNYFF